MAFDFKKSLIKVQGGRTYLPVSARLIWFREEHPDWGISTEAVEINHEKQYAVFRAHIYNAEGKLMATGTKKEDVKGFGDYIEKSETGAVGRALALCGFGTQFSPELDEVGGGRLADSPYPVGGQNRYGGGGNSYGGNGGGQNRYGSNDGGSNNGGATRFTPPREVSAPPAERDSTPPAPRTPEPAARAPEPAPRRPAPAPSPVEDDDDFESLVGGNDLNGAEDDPFGDEPADDAPKSPARPASPATTTAPGGPPACINCGKALTKAQQELSIRNYGEALCPVCQKDKTRRPALAER
jgi:hypothetical protein